MASVPLSIESLEEIATSVARDLLEQWAIDDRYTEDNIFEATQNAISDTIFVINRYMEEVNTYMLVEAEKPKLILDN